METSGFANQIMEIVEVKIGWINNTRKSDDAALSVVVSRSL